MQIETMLSIILWGLGIIIALIGVVVALGAYIFKEHVRNADCKFDENREDHIRIFDKLDRKRK